MSIKVHDSADNSLSYFFGNHDVEYFIVKILDNLSHPLNDVQELKFDFNKERGYVFTINGYLKTNPIRHLSSKDSSFLDCVKCSIHTHLRNSCNYECKYLHGDEEKNMRLRYTKRLESIMENLIDKSTSIKIGLSKRNSKKCDEFITYVDNKGATDVIVSLLTEIGFSVYEDEFGAASGTDAFSIKVHVHDSTYILHIFNCDDPRKVLKGAFDTLQKVENSKLENINDVSSLKSIIRHVIGTNVYKNTKTLNPE